MTMYKEMKNISLDDSLLLQTSEILIGVCNHFQLESIMLAKKEKNGEYFDQFLAIGLKDDFYYDFLSREKPFLKKILEVDSISHFKNSEFKLNSEISKFAFAKRLFRKELKGFFVIESQQELNPFIELLIENIADSFLNSLNINSNDYLEAFFESIAFENSFINKNLFALSGNMSLLKGKVVEFVKNKWELKGQIVYVSEYSSNEIQLKEHLENWLNISRGGLLVIENSDMLSEEQVDILKTILEEAKYTNHILFLFNSAKKNRNELGFIQELQKGSYHFPDIFELGNKSFENLIRAVAQIFANNSTMDLRDLEFFIKYEYKNGITELINLVEDKYLGNDKQFGKQDDNLNLRDSIMNLERSRILAAKKRFKGNQIKMAKALGISRGSLQYKIKQLKIE